MEEQQPSSTSQLLYSKRDAQMGWNPFWSIIMSYLFMKIESLNRPLSKEFCRGDSRLWRILQIWTRSSGNRESLGIANPWNKQTFMKISYGSDIVRKSRNYFMNTLGHPRSNFCFNLWILSQAESRISVFALTKLINFMKWPFFHLKLRMLWVILCETIFHILNIRLTI